jgi:hypothetical protein
MSIKFVCSCGKRLRARDEMAARRSVCPRCGSPVGIPSLKPTHPGTAPAPMTPLERAARREREGWLPDLAPAQTPAAKDRVASASQLDSRIPLDTGLVRKILSPDPKEEFRRGHWNWRAHSSWLQSFCYALRATPLVFGLSLVLTVLTGLGLQLFQRLAEENSRIAWPLAVVSGLLVAPVFYVWSFLDGIWRVSKSRDLNHVPWPGRNFELVVKSSFVWLSSFLAGPAVAAGLGVYYWLQCGEPNLLDWLILGELGFTAIAYWFFALAAFHQNHRFRDLNPLHVSDVVYALGPNYLFTACICSAVLLAALFLGAVGINEIPKNSGSGLLILEGTFFGGIFCATWFVRLLSLRSRFVEAPLPTP